MLELIELIPKSTLWAKAMIVFWLGTPFLAVLVCIIYEHSMSHIEKIKVVNKC